MPPGSDYAAIHAEVAHQFSLPLPPLHGTGNGSSVGHGGDGGGGFLLEYLDDEGDWVAFRSNRDLCECIDTSAAGPDGFQFANYRVKLRVIVAGQQVGAKARARAGPDEAHAVTMQAGV